MTSFLNIFNDYSKYFFFLNLNVLIINFFFRNLKPLLLHFVVSYGQCSLVHVVHKIELTQKEKKATKKKSLKLCNKKRELKEKKCK